MLYENAILDKCGIEPNLLNIPIGNRDTNYWFDSPAEESFFTEHLLDRYGSGFLRWVSPQADISRLLLTETAQRAGRVDFLIHHPEMDKPLIVEIDGSIHTSRDQKITDQVRDDALRNESYQVIRIPVVDADEFDPSGLEEFHVLLSNLSNKNNTDNEKVCKYIQALKRAHQIQITLLQAIRYGFTKIHDSSKWNISSDLQEIELFNDDDAHFILEKAVEDILTLLRKLGKLYSVNICRGEPKISHESGSDGIHIAFSGKTHNICQSFLIQDISVHFDIVNSSPPSKPAIIKDAISKKEGISYFLSYLFRKETFWEGQLESICRTLEGEDSIVLLPTGAGKSLIFQMASFLLPGIAIVIEPIISLMDDQIENLQTVGIDRAVAISSQITDVDDRSALLSLVGRGEFLFVYIAPERFQTKEFRDRISQLTHNIAVSLIVIDEAHCVSEWGHDFRTPYLNIGRISREHCTSDGKVPPLIALTGTASRAVLKDVQRELQILNFESIITPKSFERKEMTFRVLKCRSDEKENKLLAHLEKTLPNDFASTISSFFQPNRRKTKSGLVFCPHVNGNYGVVAVKRSITDNLNVTSDFYSGKRPKHFNGDWSEHKKRAAREFKRDKIQVLVCTKSFGMGIDKPNIRFTIHYGLPFSIESFYQEAGRAGRDKERAHCDIIVSVDDMKRAKELLNPNTPTEDIFQRLKEISWNSNDDITRALYFQTKAFPGIKEEKARLEHVIKKVGNLSQRAEYDLKLPELDRDEVEKSLHRLLVLGIISDYTINYNTNVFHVSIGGATKSDVMDRYGQYVASYSEARRQYEVNQAYELSDLGFNDFALEMAALLLRFIYTVIERGRRRALSEMMTAVIDNPNNEKLTKRILRYLGATEFSEALEALVESKDGDIIITRTKEVFEEITSSNQAQELRGQVARYLESYPNNPGLLMLRALSEVLVKDTKTFIVEENFIASIDASTEYGDSGDSLNELIVASVNKIAEHDMKLAKNLQLELFKERKKSRIQNESYTIENQRDLARKFIKESPGELADKPARFLLDDLTDLTNGIIED